MSDNKENILACTLELFANKGYDAVGVQEIVDRVGITKPTLYHYFGSKEGLLTELLTTCHKQLLSKIDAAANYEGDLPNTMYKLTFAYFAYARAHQKFYRLLLAMRFYPPQSEAFKIAAPLIREQIIVLEQLFLNAAKDHGNMRGRHHTYAITYLGMVNSYIEVYKEEDVQENSEIIVKAIQQFMYGIYS